ncbi:glycosyltransferase [Williamsia sterculiae]|uniref:Glycosyltransferase involved in cell wall bisynthesis n=1 Tax=Williamsia sterculiae TaxID=1344003 RepID=A0A1N7CZ59_9NOCA|nr:glycosyltransferase [Williamsia sterculiae]SIR68902.1 Glycosyltransferase involved in cell wall bisynthesis [Williamsia sterculiae]
MTGSDPVVRGDFDAATRFDVAAPAHPRIAIAHDYLTQRGGAEKVVLAMARVFPDAPIYTTLYEPDGTYPEFAHLNVIPSALNRVGPLRGNHRAALPLLPFAARSIHIDADVVLTSTSGWAHGFTTTGKKLAYCYSPARWLYQSEAYLGSDASRAKKLMLGVMSGYLKRWDRRSAISCDAYLAISSVVQTRIHDTYGIDANVLFAPHTPNDATPEPIPEVEALAGDLGFHLCVSRLLPYKNVDKVIDAFRDSHRRLVVVGRGPEAARLRRTSPSNVLMLQDLSDGQMRWLYQRCRAVVAASYEDYGLTPLEAGVHGKPSAVLRWGGFLDTVLEGTTGVYFDRPDPRDIVSALDELDDTEWNEHKIALHVAQFSEASFSRGLHNAVDDLLDEHRLSTSRKGQS